MSIIHRIAYLIGALAMAAVALGVADLESQLTSAYGASFARGTATDVAVRTAAYWLPYAALAAPVLASIAWRTGARLACVLLIFGAALLIPFTIYAGTFADANGRLATGEARKAAMGQVGQATDNANAIHGVRHRRMAQIETVLSQERPLVWSQPTPALLEDVRKAERHPLVAETNGCTASDVSTAQRRACDVRAEAVKAHAWGLERDGLRRELQALQIALTAPVTTITTFAPTEHAGMDFQAMQIFFGASAEAIAVGQSGAVSTTLAIVGLMVAMLAEVAAARAVTRGGASIAVDAAATPARAAADVMTTIPADAKPQQAPVPPIKFKSGRGRPVAQPSTRSAPVPVPVPMSGGGVVIPFTGKSIGTSIGTATMGQVTPRAVAIPVSIEVPIEVPIVGSLTQSDHSEKQQYSLESTVNQSAPQSALKVALVEMPETALVPALSAMDFIGTSVHRHRGADLSFADAYGAYSATCVRIGTCPDSRKAFSAALKVAGFNSRTLNGRPVYIDIGLRK